MTPNREAKHVATCAVKPSVVVVPTCKTTKDNQITRGGIRSRRVLRIAGDAEPWTPWPSVACETASKRDSGSADSFASNLKSLDTARGYGACYPRREHKTPTTRTATSSRSVLLSFYDFGAGAPDSRNQTEHAQKRDVVLLTKETEGRVSGGDRASSSSRNSADNSRSVRSLTVQARGRRVLGTALLLSFVNKTERKRTMNKVNNYINSHAWTWWVLAALVELPFILAA